MIEADMKAAQVLGPIGGDARDEILGGDAFGFGLEHDRRAVRIVRAYEMHGISQHPLEAHPDVGLDVFHDMPDVERAVGVGQRGGDEEFAGHLNSLQRAAAFRRRDRAPAAAAMVAAAGAPAWRRCPSPRYEASRNCSNRDLLIAFLKASLPVI